MGGFRENRLKRDEEKKEARSGECGRRQSGRKKTENSKKMEKRKKKDQGL